MRQLHGRVGEAASAIASGNDSAFCAHLTDVLPQPGHVAGRENSQREDHCPQIAVQEALVVDFLAADRFDGDDVGAGYDVLL